LKSPSTQAKREIWRYTSGGIAVCGKGCYRPAEFVCCSRYPRGGRMAVQRRLVCRAHAENFSRLYNVPMPAAEGAAA
jgi:hypothetical protein